MQFVPFEFTILDLFEPVESCGAPNSAAHTLISHPSKNFWDPPLFDHPSARLKVALGELPHLALPQSWTQVAGPDICLGAATCVTTGGATCVTTGGATWVTTGGAT